MLLTGAIKIIRHGGFSEIRQRFIAKKNVEKANQIYANICRSMLNDFLSTPARIKFPEVSSPEISMIVILYNRADLTFSFLCSLLSNVTTSFELIIIDNDSKDETHQLLDRIDGARIIKNSENTGFVLACNQGAQLAKGKYILLINNDTYVMPNALGAALETLKESEEVGAVGAKIVMFNGKVQHAGHLIGNDGSTMTYAFDASPLDPKVMYRRNVESCMGAFLMTRTSDFLAQGGFDVEYSPGYYEEVDYCIRLRKSGKKIVYQPDSVLYHYGSASAPKSSYAINLTKLHKVIFCKKHCDYLKALLPLSKGNELWARSAGYSSTRILILWDQLPTFETDKAVLEVLENLTQENHEITFYPLSVNKIDWNEAYQFIPRTVEVMLGYGVTKLDDFIRERQGYYQTVVVDEKIYQEEIKTILIKYRADFGQPKVISRHYPGHLNSSELISQPESALL